tara:strand:- start:641 stop:880 length:240 start_codon:yes stop_codon:yes gene_type:complete
MAFKMSGFPLKTDYLDDKTNPKGSKDKLDWSKAPAPGTQARTSWYQKNNLKLDDTTPKVDDFPAYVGKFQEGTNAKDTK